MAIIRQGIQQLGATANLIRTLGRCSLLGFDGLNARVMLILRTKRKVAASILDSRNPCLGSTY